MTPEQGERRREQNRDYKRRNRERIAARRRELYAVNAEKERERMRRWREANRDTARSCVKSWEERNAGRIRSHNAAKDARRRAPEANVEFVDLDALLAQVGSDCHICGDPVTGDLHWDHVRPLKHGGSHTTDNLRPAHPECNIRKGATQDAASSGEHPLAAEGA